MESIIKLSAIYSTVLARLAIGTAFLSAIADHFGLWGAPGTAGVFWGDFKSFLEYTAYLNPYLHSSLVPAMAWFVTITEVVLGIMIIAGLKTRLSAFISGILLLAFAISMALVLGIKGVLDYSVLSAASCCFLLAGSDSFPWSFDAWRSKGEGLY